MSDIGFTIGGNNAEFLAAMKACQTAVDDATEGIKSTLGGLSSVFKGITGAIAGIGTALAGGAAFKEVLETTVNLTQSSIDLGNQFGISATRASELRTGLDTVYVSQDQFAKAGSALTRTLTQHEERFQALGVATRNQDGSYRNTLDIMLDVNEALGKLSDGTARNVEAQRIYGRSWQEVQRILLLNNDVMQQAQERAAALGLTTSVEDVEATIKYREAMAEVKEVIEAVEKAIGTALLPVLTSVGEWFGQHGPQVVEIFRVAIAGLNTVWQGLKLSFEIVYDVIAGGIQQLVVRVETFAATAGHALKFDFAGAKKAWNDGMAELDRISADYLGRIAKNAQEAHDSMMAGFQTAFNGPQSTAIAEPTGGLQPPDQSKDTMAQWEEQLAAVKSAYEQQQLAAGQFHEFSKAQELDFWQNILATTNAQGTNKVALQRKIYDLEYQIALESNNAQLAGLKSQEAAFKNNLDAKLTAAQAYQTKIAATYGTESKEYAEASKEIIAIEREKVAQLAQIDAERQKAADAMALAQVDYEQAIAQQNVSLYRSTEAQLLQQEKTFEDQRYQIKLQAMQRALQLAKQDPDSNPVEIAKLNAQIEQLAQQHASTLLSINNKLVLQQRTVWISFFQTLQQSFSQNVAKMLEGSESFGQGVRNIFMSIGDAIIQSLVNIAAQWLTTQVANLVATKTSAAGQVAAQAAVAGASGTASFAGAPWPIDIGAPIFGASMFADAMSYTPASAGGFEVPAGVNPVTQLHERETVLPRDLSEGVKGMIRNNGGSSAGRREGDVHLHAHGIDSQSIDQMLNARGGTIARKMRDIARRRR